MPLNDLPQVDQKPDGYVIVGGGKTGMDAVLWLLGNGVAPDDIRWIMPRDGWMLDRKNAQSDIAFFKDAIGGQAAQFEAIAACDGVEDLFDRLEASGVLLRIDPDVRPKMFHAATISQAELAGAAPNQGNCAQRTGAIHWRERDRFGRGHHSDQREHCACGLFGQRD